jgi:predicted double-glycine peptidase
MRFLKQRICALGGFAGIVVLASFVYALPLSVSYVRKHSEVFKKLRAWTMGAHFVTDKEIVLQLHDNDCGPASLKMILSSHGINVGLSVLAADLHLSMQGTSMLELRQISTKRGVPAKSWMIHPRDLQQVPLPAIAFINKNHFVVIRKFVTPEILEIDDPAIGRLQWPTRAFQRFWSGETLVFDPAWIPL